MRITDELRKPGIKRMILDTDTYNEIDDQFALSLAMLAPERIDLAAVTAAPFHNDKSSSFADGMERSYREIGICTRLVAESHGVKIPPYFRGSTARMPDPLTPVDSEAADRIAEIAMAYDGITFVTAIGAITNVASAILKYPEIREKIGVIWLGGHAKWFNGAEFNMQGDVNAANAVFASGVPLLQFPCAGVVSHLILDIYELEHFLRGNSPLGDYLCDNVAECKPTGAVSWSRVIWDISTVAGVIDPGCFSATEEPRLRVREDLSYEIGAVPGNYEHVNHVSRDRIFSILFSKLCK
ncbi:MAG: nucleoside hydrolase [Clostridia bacterium]|nr:nucleoside hydrolase [Clostridia bacterium]MBR5367281.1 nucleoside hydrolase [Clostridia bacterium]